MSSTWPPIAAAGGNVAGRKGKKVRIAKMVKEEEAENPKRDFDRDRTFMEKMRGRRKKRD